MTQALQRRRPAGWTILLAVAAALLAAPSAHAQTQVDETRPAARDVRLEVSDIVVGSLRIVGWDREEIRVTGELGADVDRLSIEGDRGRYEIEVQWDEGNWNWNENGRRGRRDHDRHGDGNHRDVEIDLEISVPRGARLQIEGVTVGIDVDGVDGDVDVETVTGEIDYRGGARTLSLATVTGTIRVASPQVERLDVETVQGNIEFTGGFASGARLSFEAVGGSIVMRVPGDAAASFDIETMSGRIENDFGHEPVRESRWVPSSELRFSIGGGGASVSIETLQGSVEIRRQ